MAQDKTKETKVELEDLLDGRRKFTIEMENGEVKEYYIGMPTAAEVSRADWEYTKTYNKAIRDGVLTASEMREILKKRGIIGPEYEIQGEELKVSLAEKIVEMERETDKDVRIQIALDVANLREEIFLWNQSQTGPMASTCEQISEDSRVELLTSCIVQNKDGSPVWDSYEAYKTESDIAVQAKARFEVLLWFQGLESDFLDKTPENLVLKEMLDEAMEEAEKAAQKELPEGETSSKALSDEEEKPEEKPEEKVEESVEERVEEVVEEPVAKKTSKKKGRPRKKSASKK